MAQPRAPTVRVRIRQAKAGQPATEDQAEVVARLQQTRDIPLDVLLKFSLPTYAPTTAAKAQACIRAFEAAPLKPRPKKRRQA